MSNEMIQAAPSNQGALEVREQVNQIQYLMKEVLKDGEHYGTIPGCGNKPTLLQSGAEKIAYMFHLIPTYEVIRSDLGSGHREYEVTCTLAHRDTGQGVGVGVGICTTMESKYRFKYKKENPNIADTWNTVLKMAKKRAFVDAVKSTTAASDIFTQDIEDMPHSVAVTAPVAGIWDGVRQLKEQALAAGTTEQEMNQWMATYIVGPDGTPKDKQSYSAEEVDRLKTYLKECASKQNVATDSSKNNFASTQNSKQNDEEIVEAELLPDDIEI